MYDRKQNEINGFARKVFELELANLRVSARVNAFVNELIANKKLTPLSFNALSKNNSYNRQSQFKSQHCNF